MNAVSREDVDVRAVGVDYFFPEDYLLNILRRATANKQDLLIELEGVGEIILLSSRGEYFGFATDMERFCTAPVDSYVITVLGAEHLRMPGVESIGRNIDELIWLAAFHASGGRLMQGCFRDDVVELESWPNFTRLPHTPSSMRIAALFSRHPTSVYFASRLLKLDPQEMYRFYSAARAAGYARPINRVSVEPQAEPQPWAHRNRNLFASLLKKIAGL